VGVALEIAKITVRQLLGRRRTLLLLLLSALPILLAVVFRAAGETGIRQFTRNAFEAVDVTILMPLVAILFGSGAFGAEMDDGTIVYLLAKPVPRVVTVLAKAASAFLLSIALTGTATAVAGLIDLGSVTDGIAATEAQVLAVVVGSACYASLFLAVSLYTRRALVIGIGYMLVWEGALSVLLPGIANLSIRQYALGATAAIYKLPLREPAPMAVDTAFILAAIVVGASLVVATRKLMRFQLPGGTD
jgi:ABC-2 type transport system permease protein